MIKKKEQSKKERVDYLWKVVRDNIYKNTLSVNAFKRQM